MVWGEEQDKGKVLLSSRHIKGTYYRHDITIDVNLGHVAEVEFLTLLVSKIPSFLLLKLFPLDKYSV